MYIRMLLALAALVAVAGCFTPMHTQSPPRAPAYPEPGAPIDRATLLGLDTYAVLYLDVRNAREFADGHLPGALNVPVTEVAARLEEIRILAAGRPIVVYCAAGKRAEAAIKLLAGAGVLNTRHLAGDYRGWLAAGLPIEREKRPPENEWRNWYY